MERDLVASILSINFSISTHTLTWSVTIKCTRVTLERLISTHTLTWSVTL